MQSTVLAVQSAIASQSIARFEVLDRRGMSDFLSEWNSADSASSISMLLIGLDRFKQVNDTLGYCTGDRVLDMSADRIVRTLEADDRFVRLGGDEFAVLRTTNPNLLSLQRTANRILETLQRPFVVEGNQINVGASVGCATLDEKTDDSTDLLRHADLALLAAKRQGGMTVRFFESHLAQAAISRREMELELRRAVALKQFKVNYQAQMRMSTRSVCGFEALVRWETPEGKHISPADFIPLAEEIGEINAIGEWVLRTACVEAMNWDEDHVLAVNVSPKQFESDNFVAIVKDALHASGLPPERLELEITEGVLLQHTADSLSRLWAIREMGVRIAMDDFGTGYSSLSSLNSFPFTSIKIDQSFIRGEQTIRSKKLVKAIIALGASLGMTTIAEGVETPTQLEELSYAGCDEVQGYLISRPIPPEAIPSFLATRASLSIPERTECAVLSLR